MKVFRSLFLVTLISAFTFTACKEEQDKAVEPAQQDQAIKDLAVKWNNEAKSEQAFKNILAQYQGLDANRLNDFIKADAAYQVSAEGLDKQEADLRAQVQLEINRLSVEKYGKSYNQITTKQLDEVLAIVTKTSTYDQLSSRMNAKATMEPTNKGGRTNTQVCNAPFTNYWSCPDNPFRANYADGAVQGSYWASSDNKCAVNCGWTVKNGQTDCDYYLYYGFSSTAGPIYWQMLNSKDSGLNVQLVSHGPYGKQVLSAIRDPKTWLYDNIFTVLMPGARVNVFMGGIQKVANWTKIGYRPIN